MPAGEIIRLDARVVSVIADAVFRVELANGHGLTAFAGRSDRERARGLGPGDPVSVDVSPCDFSKGQLVFKKEADG
mgnify:CR=1 FL=1